MIPSRQRKVVITGAGVLCPIGAGLPQLAEGLKDGVPGIRAITRFPTDRYRCRTAGEVDERTLPQVRGIESRATRMVHEALRQALEGVRDAPITRLVVGTTSGGMGYGEAFYRRIAGGAPPRREEVREYLPARPVMDASRALGIEAPCVIVSTACASGTDAIGMAFGMVRSGRATAVLCGGYDVLAELVHAGFDALQASTESVCRPFDRHRTGLVLGEGAAFFLVESEASARAGGRQPLAEIAGYGSAIDNHHLTQPNPDGSGPLRAMRRALESAAVAPEALDYINAHGTGTRFNDASEGAAIAALAPATPVSSTKGLMGHSLGAAGAVETAICLSTLATGRLPGNANLREPDPEIPLALVRESRSAKLDLVLSNSFGFGGSNASLLLRRWTHG